MKNVTLITAGFIILNFAAFSQPVLTVSNSVFNFGETSTSYLADTTGVQQGASGAGQTWNFSNLSIGTSSTTTNYVDPSGTPYSSNFPASTLAALSGNDYTYYQLSGNDYLLIGLANSSLIMVYSDPTKFLNFPFSYNSNITDNCASTYTISSITYNMTGTTTTTADGYGNLVLPSGTYNTLRIKFVQNATSTSTSVTMTTNTISYFWYDGVHKNALLNITYTENTVMGTTTKNKVVSVLADVAALNDFNTDDVNLNIFPNPAKDAANIIYSLDEKSDVSFSVYNSTGQNVLSFPERKLQAGNYTESINVNGLPKGIYSVIMNVNGIPYRNKLCIQ